MDHSYFTTRNKKLDHSYYCVAKKTPTVVLRKAQIIREQRAREQLPVDKDHSYHKRFPSIPPSSVSKKYRNKIQHNSGVKNNINYSRPKFKKLKKKISHCPPKILDDICVIDDSDLNLYDMHTSIQFEHSYYNRCQLPTADAHNCDTCPILSNLNKDIIIKDDKDNPSKDSSHFYFLHDHAYISLKLFSGIHLNMDEVCS